jgi:hypothetical protein
MKNKSLGRGFREISNVFISTSEKSGASSKKTKEIDESSEISQCPTFVDHHEDTCGKDKTTVNSENIHAYHEKTLTEMLENSGDLSDLAENMREVEENVLVEKNISYPNTQDSQQNIIKALCTHLEEGFRIQTIELVKTDTKCRPGKKKSKTEKVTIFLEEPPALAKI